MCSSGHAPRTRGISPVVYRQPDEADPYGAQLTMIS